MGGLMLHFIRNEQLEVEANVTKVGVKCHWGEAGSFDRPPFIRYNQVSLRTMEAVMAMLTIEVPEDLAQQIEQRGFSSQRLEQMFVNFVQIYLQEFDRQEAQPTVNSSGLLDGATFARQVIGKNRELFEELARL
ncbi:MAG: hypothetical protein Fur0044_13940 [Anaerolineae bacterium]